MGDNNSNVSVSVSGDHNIANASQSSLNIKQVEEGETKELADDNIKYRLRNNSGKTSKLFKDSVSVSNVKQLKKIYQAESVRIQEYLNTHKRNNTVCAAGPAREASIGNASGYDLQGSVNALQGEGLSNQGDVTLREDETDGVDKQYDINRESEL